MRVLVLATAYSLPNERPTHFFVQTRNIYYKNKGIDITVLNFAAKENYIIDDIKVITSKEYKNNTEKYNCDLLVSHAPNLRNHYMFLKKYEKNFKNLVFFFHGHEVLKINKVYPKPYKFVNKNFAKRLIQDIYDEVKLHIWRKYYLELAYKSNFIFVSNSLYKEFLKWLKIDSTKIEEKVHIINNCVGEGFERKSYDLGENKKYDFITIRNNMDNSCYAIDIVNELAKNNPKYKFLLVGKGKYFQYNTKANNIIWMDKILKHNEIIELLNQSKCALMPTRRDTQGLMACEMATFGIPLITSNIPICHEIFENFENVKLIRNENTDLELGKMLEQLSLKLPYTKNQRYFSNNTIEKEIEIYRKILKEN